MQELPITIEGLSNKTKIPVKYLREQDIYEDTWNGTKVLTFNYYDQLNIACRCRCRFYLDEPHNEDEQKYKWGGNKQLPMIPYGLHMITKFASYKEEDLLLPEGETDSLTCWYQGIPAIGITGNGMWGHLQEEHILETEAMRVHIVQEHDGIGGLRHVLNGLKRLETFKNFKGSVYVLKMPKEAKDINELYKYSEGKGIQQRIKNMCQKAELIEDYKDGIIKYQTLVNAMDAKKKQSKAMGDIEKQLEHGEDELTEEEIPYPKPKPFTVEKLIADKFTYDLLPESMTGYIRDVSNRMQTSPEYVAVSLLTCLSSLLALKEDIRPKMNDDWTVTPNLWGAVLGRAGVMKTGSIIGAANFLKNMDEQWEKVYQDDVNFHSIKVKVDEAKEKSFIRELTRMDDEEDIDAKIRMANETKEDDTPRRKRYFMNSTSQQKLQDIQCDNPDKPMFVFRDELYGLFKELERSGNEHARQYYLEGSEGRVSFTSDTISRDTNTAPYNCICVLGGIQPSRLMEYVIRAMNEGLADDGLIQRFQLLVWPELSKTWENIDRKPLYQAHEKIEKMFDYFDKLTPEIIKAQHDKKSDTYFVRFEQDAYDLFIVWLKDIEINYIRNDDLHQSYVQHISKFKSLIPSIALILHVADGQAGNVSKKYIQMALKWFKFLKSHANKVYSHFLSPHNVRMQILVSKMLAGKLEETFTIRDIVNRKQWTGLRVREEVLELVNEMVEMKWVIPIIAVKTSKGGHTTDRWTINPRIYRFNKKLKEMDGESNE